MISQRVFAVAMLLMIAAIMPLAALRARAQDTKTSAPAAQDMAHFTGHVVTSDGAPAAGAEIAFFKPFLLEGGPPRQVLVERAKSDGSFSIEAPSAAQVQTRLPVVVRAPGFSAAAMDLERGRNNSVSLSPSTSIRVTLMKPPGKPAAGVRIHPRRSVIGNIALGDATIIEFPPQWARDLEQTTNADGTCVLQLPRGATTFLRIDDAQYAQIPLALVVRTGTGTDNEPAVLRLQEAGTARGTVVYDDSGKPATGIHLIALCRQPGQGSECGADGELVTDSGGNYLIRQMASGTCVVHLYEPQSFPLTAAFQTIEVSAGNTTTVPPLRLVKGTVVSGRVYEYDTKKPMAGARVYAVDLKTHEYPGSMLTDKDGNYRLRVPPGDAEAIYLGELPPQGYSVYGADSVHPKLIEAINGVDFHLDLRLAPKTGKNVRGRVVDVHGKPAPGARIRVVEPGQYPEDTAFTTADDAGNFMLKGISKETQLDAYWNKVATTSSVTVNGGEENVTLQLAAFDGFDVTGTVTDLEGRPRPDVWIRLGQPTGTNNFAISRGPDSLTDAQGRFSLPHLRPHTFLVLGGERFWEKRVDLKFSPDKPTLDLGQIKLEPKY